MFAAGKYTEIESLVGSLDQQLESLRTAAFGLTDDQARETPCRGALSVGGLIKHVTFIMIGREWRREDPTAMPDAEGFAMFMDAFAMNENDTLAGVLEAFDAVRAEYIADVKTLDPGADMILPPEPWDGVFTATETVVRYKLVHHVVEFSRHAGHADIIREQIDGAAAASLQLAAEGREGNDFVQPWQPADK